MPRTAICDQASFAVTMNWYTSMLVPVVDCRPVEPTAAPASWMDGRSGLVMKRNRSHLPISLGIGLPEAYFSAGTKPGRSRMSGSMSVWQYTV